MDKKLLEWVFDKNINNIDLLTPTEIIELISEYFEELQTSNAKELEKILDDNTDENGDPIFRVSKIPSDVLYEVKEGGYKPVNIPNTDNFRNIENDSEYLELLTAAKFVGDFFKIRGLEEWEFMDLRSRKNLNNNPKD
jgi:hypothetical protein